MTKTFFRDNKEGDKERKDEAKKTDARGKQQRTKTRSPSEESSTDIESRGVVKSAEIKTPLNLETFTTLISSRSTPGGAPGHGLACRVPAWAANLDPAKVKVMKVVTFEF